MGNIEVLDQSTIDKIAAGEVVERPASVVKELVENAIDAGATAVTVEIKEGGIGLIRITDNGSGISKEDVPTAFLRHATSKIRKVEDLIGVPSLGFRGEALSSIASVSQVELITKTAGALTGIRYQIEGGIEKAMEEIGAPQGTTFLVRNLFYNTPARKKFLKSPVTEASYINDLMEHLALSHPDISFKFISKNQTKLHTSGNANLKDIIYGVYGREIAKQLIEIHAKTPKVSIHGFIGKSSLSRGNRNYESYFINGRYIKSKLLYQAVEDGYKTFMMQHKYPFAVLHFEIDGELLDVNVHPNKMELRFENQEELHQLIYEEVKAGLHQKELIPEVTWTKEKEEVPAMKQNTKKLPEPFEENRRKSMEVEPSFMKASLNQIKKDSLVNLSKQEKNKLDFIREEDLKAINSIPFIHTQTKRANNFNIAQESSNNLLKDSEGLYGNKDKGDMLEKHEQMNFFEEKLLSQDAKQKHHFIGQIFDTYWLVQFEDKLYMIDQHAAHEKVLYERTIKGLKSKEHTSQYISPPIVVTLTMQEAQLLKKYQNLFEEIGFEIEPFGGKEYAISAVPGNLYGLIQKDVFIEMLDELEEQVSNQAPDIISEKIASMSCKAAVKGNHSLSLSEAQTLIEELLTLDNPYHCPHGRPTIISMTKYEIEKKFKRIV